MTFFRDSSPSGCFRLSDRFIEWDSQPLEIADFHGILVFSESRETQEKAELRWHGHCAGHSVFKTMISMIQSLT
jgi:hypothetical protein